MPDKYIRRILSESVCHVLGRTSESDKLHNTDIVHWMKEVDWSSTLDAQSPSDHYIGPVSINGCHNSLYFIRTIKGIDWGGTSTQALNTFMLLIATYSSYK